MHTFIEVTEDGDQLLCCPDVASGRAGTGIEGDDDNGTIMNWPHDCTRQSMKVLDVGAAMIEASAWLRLDSGYQDAADNADPLTIDVYDTRGDYEAPFYSVRVSALVERMIESRAERRTGLIHEGAEELSLIRDELRRLADRIDQGIATASCEVGDVDA